MSRGSVVTIGLDRRRRWRALRRGLRVSRGSGGRIGLDMTGNIALLEVFVLKIN